MTKTTITIFTILFLSLPINAGVLDVITGHAKDIKSRFAKDEFIISNPKDSAIKKGSIDTNAKGQDFLHNASGDIYIVKKDNQFYIQLDKNFKSSPGPDYHVYISKSNNIKDEDDFDNGKQIDLGSLIKGSGASYYLIKDINPTDIKSATILCKRFHEYIGSSNLD
jgi:hypothetical protein